LQSGCKGGQGPLQSGCKGGICGHSASAFGNSVSMPIAALGLSGHCNGYRATVAVICNRYKSGICGYLASAFGNSMSMLIAILVAIGPS
jgi:hypothetical protein